jgi:hypothetical protein
MVTAYYNLQVEFPLTYTDLTQKGTQMARYEDDVNHLMNLVRQSATLNWKAQLGRLLEEQADIRRGVFLQLCAGAGIVIPAGILTVDQLTTPFRQLREFYSRR